ncbi:MAG TPA: SDR family NAD(P)-dependent oxidoreductase [Inquilinus sp.]|nr:SDR family NAD(P)-dependent oxidoreductase [Inquilinus sp.]
MVQDHSRGLAVITGASSGIGAVYADRLAAQGYQLLLIARRADRLETIAADLKGKHGASVTTLVADLELSEDLARLASRIGDEDVTMLVNNAGAGGLGPTAKAGAEQLERTISLNITAVTRLSHAALARFRDRGTGTLVNIGSNMAHEPAGGGAVYSGSKAYVLNFTRSLQIEYANSGIRIQVVMPGPVHTEFFSSQGVSEAVFPASAYLTAEQLVDAALAGLAAGEAVTIPSMVEIEPWTTLEAARVAFYGATLSGQVGQRYHGPGRD